MVLAKKDFPQASHWKGRTSLWVRTCLSSVALWENAFWHTLHSKGLSPV